MFSKLIALLDRPGRIKALRLFSLLLCGAMLEAFVVGLIMPYIALINNPDLLQKYQPLVKFFHIFGLSSVKQIIVGGGVLLALAYLVKNFFLWVIYLFQFRFIYSQQSRIASKLLSSYLSKPYIFHIQKNSAEILRNVNHDVLVVFDYILVPLFVMFAETLVTVTIMGLLFFVQPLPALIVLLMLGGSTYACYLRFRKKLRRLGEELQVHLGEMNQWINQSLGGIKFTKLLGKEDYFVHQYHKSCTRHAEAQGYNHLVQYVPRLFIETATVVSTILLVLLILWHGGNTSSLVPTLGLFAMAAMRCMPSINRIITAATSIRYYKPALEVVYRDLHETDPAKASLSPPDISTPKVLSGTEKWIEVKNVSYEYPGTQKRILDKVSLSIPRGGITAFLGSSGAGKSTLIDILIGLLSPTEGEILVDGKDIQADLKGWQRRIGYIPQSIFLIDDTVRRNIAYGLIDSEIDDSRVWKVLELAHLDTFIRELPQQLDTRVGERGVRFSGGQQQRLGIARALYQNPEILVFDEATSSLDLKTEQDITKSILELSHLKTCFLISHRLSIMKYCDRIYKVNGGGVFLQGPPHEGYKEGSLA